MDISEKLQAHLLFSNAPSVSSGAEVQQVLAVPTSTTKFVGVIVTAKPGSSAAELLCAASVSQPEIFELQTLRSPPEKRPRRQRKHLKPHVHACHDLTSAASLSLPAFLLAPSA